MNKVKTRFINYEIHYLENSHDHNLRNDSNPKFYLLNNKPDVELSHVQFVYKTNNNVDLRLVNSVLYVVHNCKTVH